MAATLEQLEAVARAGAAVQARVGTLLQDLNAISQVAAAVNRVAVQTHMLSLNAAIEAARAGVHAQGFSVVAQEIRKLAQESARSAKEIGLILGRAGQSIEETGRAADDLAGASAGATGAAEAAGGRLGQMFARVEEVAEGIRQTADAAVAQAALAEEMTAGGAAVGEGVRQMADVAAAMAGRQAAPFVERGQQALAHFRYGGRFERCLDRALLVAAEVEAVFQGTVGSGRVRLDDFLDTNYIEIKGDLVRRLAHLFDVSRAPRAGFDPPKYATRADHLIDLQVREVLDRHMAGSGFVSMGVTDINGFALALPSSACRDWSGDPVRDTRGNRIKRIFDDPVGLRAARVGLPDGIPRRASRQEFGPALDAPSPPGTFLAQTYARDTGAVVTDIAVPLYVAGRRYGALRCGFTVDA